MIRNTAGAVLYFVAIGLQVILGSIFAWALVTRTELIHILAIELAFGLIYIGLYAAHLVLRRGEPVFHLKIKKKKERPSPIAKN